MRRPGEHRNFLLLLSGNEATTRDLSKALASVGDITIALTVEELFRLLKRSEYDAFLYDWDFQGADWREICHEVQQDYENLPIIVVSRCGGEQEWVEVLKAGCFDLISAPYSDRYVLSVIEHAVASSGVQDFERVA